MALRNILLIQPPIEDFYETDIRLQPIGLCYLKSTIQQYYPEINVKVLDFHSGWGRKSIPIPKSLEYSKSPDKISSLIQLLTSFVDK